MIGYSYKKRGFTLIELSIVLVIVALLVAGILVGRELIRTSTLRKLTAEKDSIVTAVYAFKLKYGGLPGDWSGAERIWGTDPNGCPATSNAVGKVETCNGNDNGMIDSYHNTYYEEHFRFWQQLANAGLWAGSFSGTRAAGDGAWLNQGTEVVAGANIPFTTTFPGMGWMAMYVNKTSTDSWYVASNYGNLLMPGNMVVNFGAGSWFPEGFLTVAEIYGLDLKIDDGMPYTGKLRIHYSLGGVGCATSTALTATYDPTITGTECAPIFANQF